MLANSSNSRSLRLGLILIALLILAWNLVRVVSLSITEPAALPEVNVQARAANAQWRWFGGNSVSAVRAVPANNPGGDARSSDPDKEYPDARTNARLLGVVLSAEQRVATIATPSDQKGVFLEGDELARDVTVEEIQPNRVLVNEQGVTRQLVMSVYDTSEQAVTRTERQTQTTSFSLPDISSAADVADQYGVRIVGTNEWGTAIRVDSIPDTMQGTTALQAGDQVIRIAGNTIQELVRNAALRDELLGGGSLPITVVRDDQPIEIIFNPADLPPEIRAMFGDI